MNERERDQPNGSFNRPPSFLRREAAAAKAPSDIEDQVRHVLENYNMLQAECSALRARASELEVELALVIQRNHQLELSNTRLEAERDHYMRFSAEIAQRLNNIRTRAAELQASCDEAVTAAQQQAYRPAPSTNHKRNELSSISEEEAQRIADLAARLAPEGDQQ